MSGQAIRRVAHGMPVGMLADAGGCRKPSPARAHLGGVLGQGPRMGFRAPARDCIVADLAHSFKP